MINPIKTTLLGHIPDNICERRPPAMAAIIHRGEWKTEIHTYSTLRSNVWYYIKY